MVREENGGSAGGRGGRHSAETLLEEKRNRDGVKEPGCSKVQEKGHHRPQGGKYMGKGMNCAILTKSHPR